MKKTSKNLGYLSLVLHAHLPYVRHPEQKDFLEENWLFEAITETYIPLLNVFQKLIKEHVNFRMTVSLTPPLVSMLLDPLLQERYSRYISRLIDLADKEIKRTRHEPYYHDLAVMYHEKFLDCKIKFMKKFGMDLVGEFKKLQEKGFLEIIAGTATHGFLPVLNVRPQVVKAQVQIGADFYRKIFDRDPLGIWLSECGYVPGIDELLAKEGIRYFFVDSHGIVNSDPTPRYGVYAPLYSPSGVAAFGRDIESAKQVWSAEEGYPGDPDYREYYRDIGFELASEHIEPFAHPSGVRVKTGIKYWRITGRGEYKEAYRPDVACRKASEHAAHFVTNRERQIRELSARMDRKPIVVAPYDAELYGHWWYEGPTFLDQLIRNINSKSQTLRLATPSDYLAEYPTNQMSLPSCSSWGYKGYSEFWLDQSNDWIYRHIHKAEERMLELVIRHKDVILSRTKTLIKRALNQAARELLLAQSSDWPFIMKAGTTVEYARKRITTHIGRFSRIYDDIKKGKIDENWLKEVEARDNIFMSMNCARYYIEMKKVMKQSGRKVNRTKRSK